MNRKRRELLIFTAVMVFTIALELALSALHVKDENIYLIFVLAILIIIIESQKIIYGLLASIITVLSFNFFITEPRYTFVVDDPNNYLSFLMFIVVTFMVNSLVIQLQKQISISQANESKINALYNISSDLLHAKNNDEVFELIVERIRNESNRKVSVITEDKVYGDEVDETLNEAIDYVEGKQVIVDEKNPLYRDIDYLIFPISSRLRDYGVLLISDRSSYDPLFIENVVEELLVALDKNTIYQQQEATKVEVEKEKFKTSLLRGLSHDLKTPLTMIQSGSGFLYQSYEEIDDQNKRELIRDIYDESCDLSDFVNSLLDLTRLENRNMSLNRSIESVDDILFTVNEKMKRRLPDMNLEIVHPKEVVMLEADVELLCQVFINLIDNAFTHTAQGTKVFIEYEQKDKVTEFKVIDNGGGIEEDKMNRIFDDFYSLTTNEDKKRSHGLGLSICKAIVEAHGGEIWARNNEIGGTTITFTIPNEVKNNGKDDTADRG